ncbi:MAG: hypothetical protein HY314_16185 [Acidobacteria bacterium]|nr:hypothetical protein [Acidobacteriota bacterium]
MIVISAAMAQHEIEIGSAKSLASLHTPWHEHALPYLLLAPAVLVLLLLTIYPLIYAVKISLQTPAGAWTLANFARLLEDRFFGVALLQTLIYTAAALSAEFVLGLSLALLLDTQIRARNLFRALLLMPMMLPPVVVAVIWRLLYNPNFGAINGTLTSWGIDTTKLNTIPALIIVYTGFNLPFVVLTQTDASITLPVGIAGRVTQYEIKWGAMSAAGVVAMIPILVVAMAVQRYLVRGLSLAAVKG